MKTKMSFKRAALPVLATLLTAVISLTGVTYAWFTSGTTATVDQIDIGVVAADGLQIAVNTDGNFTWGSQYTVKDELRGRTFSPLSGSATATGIDLYTAVLDDTYDMISGFTKVEGDDETYITFDLYFRNMSTTAKEININGTEVFATTGDSHTAARIAFITQASLIGSAANYTTDGFTNGKFFGPDDDLRSVVIYEPNATDHTPSGIDDYQTNHDPDAAADAKFDYKAIVAAGVSDAYYNRYTGEYYVKIANRDENTLNTANGKFYFDGSDFVEWTAAVDYERIDANNALAEFANNRSIYTKSGDTFTKVTDAANITGGTTYYICQPVEVFTKAAYDENTSAMKAVDTKTDMSETYFTLAANTVTKVTVVIWLEGQDADCNNATAGRPFSVALKFNSTTEQNGN